MKYHSYMVFSFFLTLFVTPNFALVLRLNWRTDFYAVSFIGCQSQVIAFLRDVVSVSSSWSRDLFDGSHLEKGKNCHISAKAGPIAAKYDTVIDIYSENHISS